MKYSFYLLFFLVYSLSASAKDICPQLSGLYVGKCLENGKKTWPKEEHVSSIQDVELSILRANCDLYQNDLGIFVIGENQFIKEDWIYTSEMKMDYDFKDPNTTFKYIFEWFTYSAHSAGTEHKDEVIEVIDNDNIVYSKAVSSDGAGVSEMMYKITNCQLKRANKPVY